MRISYGLERPSGGERWSWSGECDSFSVHGDEFEVRFTASGVYVHPKRDNTIPQHPIFVLPLPLPKS